VAGAGSEAEGGDELDTELGALESTIDEMLGELG
jgi:hypothetical protein